MLVYVVIDYVYDDLLNDESKDLIAVFDGHEKAEKYIFEKYEGAQLDQDPDSWFPDTYVWPDPWRGEISHHFYIVQKEVL